jgi:TonB family protein
LVPRSQAAREPRLLRAALAFALALASHGVLVVALLFLSHLKLDTPPLKRSKLDRPVSFRPLSAAQFDQNRGKDAPAVAMHEPKKRPQKPKEKKVPEQAPGQVVDVAPGNGEVSPDAKFAAETNNTVKKETRAKEQTAFYRNAMPQRTATKAIDTKGGDPVEAAVVSGNNGIGQDDRPLRETPKATALEIPNQQARSELAIRAPTIGGVGPVVANRTEVEAMKGNSKRLNLQLGAVGAEPEGSEGRAGAEGAVNLIPSPAVLDSISGAAANDHLQDVDEGDGTFLNTREWKYASFFNRVKQSVGQQWNPNAQLRLRDPTLQVYGGRDRQTLLQVTLTADGHLKEAWVERSSGLDFLDLEAVKAFERAQPFPNPPSGLVAADQTVHFQFGFYLEMSGRPGLRLFRAQD